MTKFLREEQRFQDREQPLPKKPKQTTNTPPQKKPNHSTTKHKKAQTPPKQKIKISFMPSSFLLQLICVYSREHSAGLESRSHSPHWENRRQE